MTSPAYRRLIARLAEAGGVSVTGSGTTRTVTALNQSPATFPKAAYADLGGRNFRANPARQTVSFDVDVDDVAFVVAHPVVAKAVALLDGRIDEVEVEDGEAT